MEGLVLGIDLCDSYTQISCLEDEKSWLIPTVICREKQTENWYIGEEAYGHTLIGDGVIIDKLLKLTSRRGTATIGGIRYEAVTLLDCFFREVLELPRKEYGIQSIRQIVVTLQSIDAAVMEALQTCAAKLGLNDQQLRVISHTESFIYYVMSQKKELWNNQVCVFSLSADNFCYYELKVQRGMKRMAVIAECETLEEGFNLDILESSPGGKLADKILCSCGERLLQKKLYSSVFLTGKGFLSQDWAPEFMKLLCKKRRVYIESELFSKGAAYRAEDFTRSKTAYPFICLCEGHLKMNVTMNVLRGGQEVSLTLAGAGDSWFEIKSAAEIIPEPAEEIELLITSLDNRKKKIVKIPLEGFPQRPPRTTKVRVEISFLDEQTMQVVLRDRGFGELFPATDVYVRQEVML